MPLNASITFVPVVGIYVPRLIDGREKHPGKRQVKGSEMTIDVFCYGSYLSASGKFLLQTLAFDTHVITQKKEGERANGNEQNRQFSQTFHRHHQRSCRSWRYANPAAIHSRQPVAPRTYENPIAIL
jgi:hypothetical protein